MVNHLKILAGTLLGLALLLLVFGSPHGTPLDVNELQGKLNESVKSSLQKSGQFQTVLSTSIRLRADGNRADVNLNLRSKQDTTNTSLIKEEANVSIRGSFDVDGNKGKINLNMLTKMLGDKAYFLLRKADINSDHPELSLLSDLIKRELMNTWYVIPEHLDTSTSQINYTQMGEILGQALLNNELFTLVPTSRSGTLELKIDPEKLKKVIQEVALAGGLELSDDDLFGVDFLLSFVTPQITVRTDKSGNIIGVSGKLLVEKAPLATFKLSLRGDRWNGNLNVNMEGANLSMRFNGRTLETENLVITEPMNAKIFDPEEFGFLNLQSLLN